MDHLTIIAYSGVFFNVAYVILAWFRKKVCWIFGGIGSAISVYYFLQPEIRLYNESALYFFYILMAAYGWWAWNRVDEGPIVTINLIDHIKLIGLGLGLTYLFYFITSKYTDAAMPLPDSLSSAFSIIATFMTIKKVLSNWIYWILIDLFSIWLYLSRDSPEYAVQMGIFTILAIIGYVQWRSALSDQQLSEIEH